MHPSLLLLLTPNRRLMEVEAVVFRQLHAKKILSAAALNRAWHYLTSNILSDFSPPNLFITILTMRLLNVHTQELDEYFDEDIPDYAILSHTWGKDEVSFRDMKTLKKKDLEKMSGHLKISSACKQAIRDGFKHIWIDTCCIDKTSSAELSEAINSMFKWYANSRHCYAYMSDVPGNLKGLQDLPSDNHLEPLEEAKFQKSPFRQSRWFTRGWTLQELIAPAKIHFFAHDWSYLGSKG